MPDGRQDWQAERKKTSIFRTSLGNIIIEAGHEPYRVKFPMQVNDVFKSGSLRESVTKRSVACRGGQSLSIDIHKSSSESCRSTHQEAFFVLESPISLDDRKMLLNVPATFASRIAEPGVEGQRRYLQIPLTAAGSISPLLTLTNEEMSFERRTRCKIVLSVAGICEAQSGSKKAYAWYQKKIFGLGDHNSHEGIGIAQVTLDETDSRRLVGQRCLRGAMLFNQHEPRFGQFAVSKGEGDGYIYLWGKQLDKVFLARVHAGNVVERSKYEFYNGRCFTTEMSKMNSVLEGLACGSIFTSQIFGHRYPWVLIGHNRPHNEVICGRSEAPEGPFQATPIFGGLTGKTIERFHSQIIVHPWGSREDLGQFFVTWNERNPEKVIEGSLRFGMLHDGAYWKDIILRNLPESISTIAQNYNNISHVFSGKDVNWECSADINGRAIITIFGSKKSTVEKVSVSMCRNIVAWCQQKSGGREPNEGEKRHRHRFRCSSK